MATHDFLVTMREALAHQGIDVDIITDDDAEVFIDDWIYRVHVEADVAD